jgi:glyoxylase-like metal-dependent hydrolase (beta-lactamase superfamily II)
MISVRRLLAQLAIGACVIAGGASQGFAASPEGMKLYVFTSQPLDIAKSALSSVQTGTEKFLIPVAFFLIKHPKGNILFDTGDNDRIIQDPTYWGPLAAMLDKGTSPDLAIDTQLAKVGVKPSDINFVILGHMHLDHAGNVGKFPGATIIAQRDEFKNAFWPSPGTAGPYITADFSMLRSGIGAGMANKQPTIELDGDLDLFGDGSVYIHRAVSHTPGSQIALIRLPQHGLVVLTSDVCYLKENLEKDILPSIGLTYDPTGMLDAYHYIKRAIAEEKGDVIFAHDPDTFKAHKHAPEYYE